MEWKFAQPRSRWIVAPPAYRQMLNFLEQALMKLDREIRDRSAAADRDLMDVRAEIATLKSRIEQLSDELAKMKGKAEPSKR